MASSPRTCKRFKTTFFGFKTRLLRMFTSSTSLFAPNSTIQTELGKMVTHHITCDGGSGGGGVGGAAAPHHVTCGGGSGGGGVGGAAAFVYCCSH
jgi:hypothetical protein